MDWAATIPTDSWASTEARRNRSATALVTFVTSAGVTLRCTNRSATSSTRLGGRATPSRRATSRILSDSWRRARASSPRPWSFASEVRALFGGPELLGLLLLAFLLQLGLGEEVHLLLRDRGGPGEGLAAGVDVRAHPAPEDMGQDLVQRDGGALERAGRVDPVLAVLVLDDGARGVPDRAVLGDLQVLEGVDQPALHVPGPARPDRRVDETLAPSHGVEEVLRRREPALVRRRDEPAGVGPQVAPAEVRQGAAEVAAQEALAPDRLLAHGARHLRQVEHGAPGPGLRQDHGRVLETEVAARDVTGGVPCLAELAADHHLEGLLDGAAGHLLELALRVLLDELGDLLPGLAEGAVDLALRLLGDVLVVDAGREALHLDGGDREAAHLVEELPGAGHAAVPGDGVQDRPLLEGDGLGVDGAGLQDAVLHHDVGVVLAAHRGAVAPVPDVGAELQREVLREGEAEQLLPRPVLGAVLLRPRRRGDGVLDLREEVRHLAPG